MIVVDVRLRRRSITAIRKLGWKIKPAETARHPFTDNHQPYELTIEHGAAGLCLCLIHKHHGTVVGTWLTTTSRQRWKRMRALGPEPPRHWTAWIKISE